MDHWFRVLTGLDPFTVDQKLLEAFLAVTHTY